MKSRSRVRPYDVELEGFLSQGFRDFGEAALLRTEPHVAAVFQIIVLWRKGRNAGRSLHQTNVCTRAHSSEHISNQKHLS